MHDAGIATLTSATTTASSTFRYFTRMNLSSEADASEKMKFRTENYTEN